VDDFYAARSGTIPPLPWTNFAPPLSQLAETIISDQRAEIELIDAWLSKNGE